MNSRAWLLGLLMASPVLAASSLLAQEITKYYGFCDASAAVALGPNHFVVGEDERNILFVFQRRNPNRVGEIDLLKYLGAKESDIEGAAKIGSRVYWIASHGRKKFNRQGATQDEMNGGVEDQSRWRFFATDLVPEKDGFIKESVLPYRNSLMNALISNPDVERLRLKEASEKAPEYEIGLNIEGLAATPEGHLLIALRNPRPNDNKAIILRMRNPAQVVESSAAPELTLEKELSLGNRGIRSLERIWDGSRYILIAGPHGDAKTDNEFSVYEWDGADKLTLLPEASKAVAGLNPEALFEIPGSNQIQILSDDGQLNVDGKECKDAPRKKRYFRSVTVSLR
jgi:hypothetical protein